MFEQVKRAYAQSLWFRLVCYAALCLYAALLFSLAGGFPPWAWRFLVLTLPQVPRLVQVRGVIVFVPLFGLVLLSLALLVLWSVFVTAWLNILIYWYQERQMKQLGTQEEQEEREDFAAQETFVQTRPPQQAQQYTSPAAAQAIYQMQTQPALHAVTGERASAPPLVRQIVGGTGREQSGTYYPASVASAVRAQVRNEPATPLPMRQSSTYGTRPTSVSSVPRPALHVMPSVYEEEDECEEQETHLYSDDEDFDTLPMLDDNGESLIAANKNNKEESLRFAIGIASDAGIARKDQPNEDNLLAIQGTCITPTGPLPVGLFVVADGMGGHANGREASRLAIQAFSDVVVPAMLRSVEDENIFVDMLKDGVHRANLNIYQRNRQQEHSMGTTITAALLVGAKAYIANVGDSRTYIYRSENATLEQVTRDHSHVALLVEKGAITRDDIYTHPKRNQIYRCLGEHASVQIDLFEQTLTPGDALLLCSDGLWEMVRDHALEDIMRTSLTQPAYASMTLIEAALNAGGADNVSAVVVAVGTEA